MIKGGVGGANTRTGAQFELSTDVRTNLANSGIDVNNVIFCSKRQFPPFMERYNFDMRIHFGKQFWPDEAFVYNNHLYVIEKKYQDGSGSVDEKIQTGPYKKLIYEICAKAAHLNGATYIYLLKGKAFNIPKYTTHQIPYLREHNVPVYFDRFPIEEYFPLDKEESM